MSQCACTRIVALRLTETRRFVSCPAAGQPSEVQRADPETSTTQPKCSTAPESLASRSATAQGPRGHQLPQGRFIFSARCLATP